MNDFEQFSSAERPAPSRDDSFAHMQRVASEGFSQIRQACDDGRITRSWGRRLVEELTSAIGRAYMREVGVAATLSPEGMQEKVNVCAEMDEALSHLAAAIRADAKLKSPFYDEIVDKVQQGSLPEIAARYGIREITLA